jgi:glutamate--cysteine ligase
LDLDPFNPIGISETSARFIEVFLLGCLLADSPLHSEYEQHINHRNQLAVANWGRQPNLELNQNGHSICLSDWANTILQNLTPIAAILDAGNPQQPYSYALNQQQCLVQNPDLTPSARMLQQLTESRCCLDTYSTKLSAQHAAKFKSRSLEAAKNQQFMALAEASHQQQQQLEAQDHLSLDDFLANYFAQY